MLAKKYPHLCSAYLTSFIYFPVIWLVGWKEIQSATLERLISHLNERKDVQNIDLMNLAGFCRNCLSRWYREEAEKKGIEISDPDAREHIYGMPYSEWKEKYQK